MSSGRGGDVRRCGGKSEFADHLSSSESCLLLPRQYSTRFLGE